MKSTSKIFSLVYLCIFLFYICMLLDVNYIYPNSQNVKQSAYGLIGIMVSWLPIIAFIFIATIYCFVLISNKYKKAKIYVYLNTTFLLSALIILLLLNTVSKLIDSNVIDIIIILLAILTIVFQYIILKKLQHLNFNFKYEVDMLKKITLRLEKLPTNRWKKFINKIFCIYFLICVINVPLLAFLAIAAIGAVVAVYPLLQLRNEYKNVQVVTNGESNWLIINYYLGTIISAIFYNYSPILALLLMFSGRIVQYVFDNKLARKAYSEIESILDVRE